MWTGATTNITERNVSAVVEQSPQESRSNGDDGFEEDFGEDLEEISTMKILDDYFLFVNRFFILYCVDLVSVGRLES